MSRVNVAMYWWQWVLQIIGAWFCLAMGAAGLWIAFVRIGRRPRMGELGRSHASNVA